MITVATLFEVDFFQAPWFEHVGWVLVHSLWQIALLAAIYAVAMLVLQSRSAQTRYIVGCVTLLAMLGLPMSTYVVLPRDVTSPEIADLTHSPAASVPPAESSQPPWENELLDRGAHAIVSPAVPFVSVARESSAALPIGETFRWVLRSPPRPVLRWATAAWLAGVFLLSLRPVLGWLHVRRLQRHGLSGISESLERVGDRLIRQLGVKRAVRFAQSALVEVPTIVGFLRPLVLLPAAALSGLSPEQLELILAHELAHVRRCDYLVNVVQSVIETVLFYHPAVWWVSARLRAERENCCDDLTVLISGKRAEYARELLRLEEQRAPREILALSASGGSLVARIRRIVGATARSESSRSNGKLLGCLIVLLLLGLPASLVTYHHHLAQAAEDPVGGPADGDSRDGDESATVAQPLPSEVPTREATTPNGLTARLTGRFIFDGKPPAPKTLKISPYRYTHDGNKYLDAGYRRWSKVEIPDESLVVGQDGGIANILVWVRSKNIPKPAVPSESPAPATVRATRGRFQPHVLAFWKAAPMKWINEMLPDGVNFQWQPFAGQARNPLLNQERPEYEFKAEAAEPLPTYLKSNLQPWMQAIILPLDHPYFAVTSVDGRFELASLPAGTWEFAFWHERCGWLKTDRFSSGRFGFKLRPGENALGDLRVSADSLSPHRPPLAVDSTRPQPTARPTTAPGEGADEPRSTPSPPPQDHLSAPSKPVDLFPPDPYPELGIVRNAGPGWHFLRLAGHPAAARDLRISPEQQEAIKLLFDAYLAKDRELEAKLRQEYGGLPPDRWERGRQAQWLKAQDLARRLLTESQVRRVEQTMVLRDMFDALLARNPTAPRSQRPTADAHNRRDREARATRRQRFFASARLGRQPDADCQSASAVRRAARPCRA